MWNTQETCSVIFCNGCVVYDNLCITHLLYFSPYTIFKTLWQCSIFDHTKRIQYTIFAILKISLIFYADYKVFCLHNYHLFYVCALILLPIKLSSLSMNCVATYTLTKFVTQKKQHISCLHLMWMCVSKETIVTNRLKSGRYKVTKFLCHFTYLWHIVQTTKTFPRDCKHIVIFSLISLVVHLIYGIKFFGNNSSWFAKLLCNLIKM